MFSLQGNVTNASTLRKVDKKSKRICLSGKSGTIQCDNYQQLLQLKSIFTSYDSYEKPGLCEDSNLQWRAKEYSQRGHRLMASFFGQKILKQFLSNLFGKNKQITLLIICL